MALKSKPVTRGPKWLRDALNTLRQDIIENRVIAGIGTKVTESQSGRAVNAAPPSSGPSSGE